MRVHPVAFVIGLLLGFALSQTPEFAQQYRQRLGGAVDELQRIVQQFDDDSRRAGYDRTSALRLMAGNPEQIVRDQASRMEDLITRYGRLRAQEEAFRNGGPFGASPHLWWISIGRWCSGPCRPMSRRYRSPPKACCSPAAVSCSPICCCRYSANPGGGGAGCAPSCAAR